jgi:hypothetical protein
MPLERSRRWWHALDRWQRAAIFVWAVALVALGAKVVLRPYTHTVYPIFVEAGRAWQAGGDPYDWRPGLDAFRYSPLVAALFVPFGLLPDALGGVLWRLLGAAAFVVGIAWWSRAALPATRAQRALLVLLPAPLAFSNVHNGQANIHVIGLLLLGVAAVARRRFNLAAACLAAACLLKLYPIAVGLLLVAIYPRRLGLRLALMLAAGLLLPFLMQRPDYVAARYADWVAHMGVNDRQLLIRDVWYRDARLLWSLWVAPMSYTTYQIVQAVGAVVVAAACVWARRASLAQPRLLALVLGLGCCWMTALGPATESNTYVLLGPSVAWLLLSGRAERHPRALRLLWLIAYGLLVVSQTAAMLPRDLGRTLHSLGPQPLAALLLLVGQLYLVWHATKSQIRNPKPEGNPQDQAPMTQTRAA